MRRILRKIASNETKELGDISTLADESVVEVLIQKVQAFHNPGPSDPKKRKLE